MNIFFNAAVAVLVFFSIQSPASTEKAFMGLPAKLNVDLHFHVEPQAVRNSLLEVVNSSGGFNAKPNRIFRHGRSGKSKGVVDRKFGSYSCGTTFIADSSTNKSEHCPQECPYFAQDKSDDRHCTFACVPAEECVKYNAETPIADNRKFVCRAPSVNHCRKYSMEATDACLECQRMFYVGADGQCHYTFMWALYLLLFVLIAVVVFVVWWMADLCLRPVTNKEGRAAGLEMRSRQKFHQLVDGKSKLWPLTSNLLRENVAGPGMTLHFNFQFMIIIWALLIALGWAILALVVDYDLLILGTRKFGSSFENCILVAWGYETQQRLMPQKVYFLVWAYLVTFLCSLLHSIRQLRVFQLMDEDNKTMSDFAAFITGMPKVKGDKLVEMDLKKAIADAAGVDHGAIEGVSVCWNYTRHQEAIMGFIKEDGANSDPDHKVSEGRKSEILQQQSLYPPQMKQPRKLFFGLEEKWFCEAGDSENDNADKEVEHAKDTLCQLETSENAFVVFRTEAERQTVVDKIKQSGGFAYSAKTLQLTILDQEPGTVNWKNFDGSSALTKILRLCYGSLYIFLGLLLWTVLFYGPYAWSVASFNYRNGQEPGFIYGFAFSMVVVIGNAIMYEICARVADFVGFLFSDDREACYMIVYTVSCTFNILLDLVTTFFMAWEIMKGLGFKTYFGERLEDVDGFNARFETYAMQRSLAENTFTYAFPSTYLIPFLLEPILTVILPYKFGELIVRTHPSILGRDAEDWLAPIPMDMGRYADLLLNVVLAVLIFFFPGGYTAKLFFFMAVCHVYIYAFDHCKVLRSIPSCTYATMTIDWWSQAMLAPCTAMILSCLIFKANGQGYGFDIKGDWVVLACLAVFWTHVVVHLLLLVYVVPLFGKKDLSDKWKDKTYAEVNRSEPLSWFSANPVHCLRSRHIYEHKTPCQYLMRGREHLLQVNEDIGCYFSCEKAEAEDFDNIAHGVRKDAEDLADLARSFTRRPPTNQADPRNESKDQEKK